MQVGVQIVDTLAPHATVSYYTWGWNPALDVVWMVVPTTPAPGVQQVQWIVGVERGNATQVTYHVRITNLTASPVGVEGRYAILNA